MNLLYPFYYLLFEVPLWYTLVPLVFLLLYWYSVRDFHFFDKYGVTGPKPYPLVGTAWPIFRKSLLEYDMGMLAEYKANRVCSVFEFGTPALVVLDVKLAKEVLIKEFTFFVNRKNIRKNQPPMHRSLLAIRDDHWKHVRNKVSPTFSGSKLKNMTPLIQKSTNSLIGVLKKHAESGESLDVKSVFSSYTMDIIASTMFALDVDSLNDPDHPFVTHANSLLNLATLKMKILIFLSVVCPQVLRLLQKLGVPFLDTVAMDYFTRHLRRTLTERRDSVEDFHDFVTMMIHAEVGDDEQDRVSTDGLKWSSRGLTQTDIVAQMFVFFLAGFDTTSNMLTMAAYNMVIHEEMQTKMQEEVDEVLDNEEPDYENVHKLHYMDMFIQETMRLYGPAPRVIREAGQDVEIDGIFFPKGIAVWIPIGALHRDPEIWPDPETFDPERFSPEQKATRDPSAFMPFSLGPRNCVAKRLADLELRIGMAKLLQKCTLELDETQSDRVIKLSKTRMLPAKPLKVKVSMR